MTSITSAGARGRELATALLRDAQMNCHIVGFVDDEPGASAWNGVPILGATADILGIIES